MCPRIRKRQFAFSCSVRRKLRRSEVFGYELLTMTTLRCSHYTFYIHIVNEFSILSSGATSPRVGGLIDSRRHVRAESLLRCNILSALARSLSSFG